MIHSTHRSLNLQKDKARVLTSGFCLLALICSLLLSLLKNMHVQSNKISSFALLWAEIREENDNNNNVEMFQPVALTS